MIKSILIALFMACTVTMAPGFEKQWWEQWDNFPNVPRITAAQAKQIMLSGERAVFIYGGYKIDEIVCGSLIIPFNMLPPYADGSRVNITSIPKDWWVLCYCP